MGAETAPPGPPPSDAAAPAAFSTEAAAPPPGAYSGPPPASYGVPPPAGAYPPPPPPPPYAAYPPQADSPPGPPPGAVPVVTIYPAPIPGVPIRTPLVAPQPGQVLLGYQLYQPQVGCCQCDGLSPAGLVAVILLVFLFWPLAWLPCVMPECFEQQQRPVYGWPAQAPPQQQAAQPGVSPAGYPSAPGFPPAAGTTAAAGYPPQQPGQQL